jgi:hypothetical protein
MGSAFRAGSSGFSVLGSAPLPAVETISLIEKETPVLRNYIQSFLLFSHPFTLFTRPTRTDTDFYRRDSRQQKCVIASRKIMLGSGFFPFADADGEIDDRADKGNQCNDHLFFFLLL